MYLSKFSWFIADVTDTDARQRLVRHEDSILANQIQRSVVDMIDFRCWPIRRRKWNKIWVMGALVEQSFRLECLTEFVTSYCMDLVERITKIWQHSYCRISTHDINQCQLHLKTDNDGVTDRLAGNFFWIKPKYNISLCVCVIDARKPIFVLTGCSWVWFPQNFRLKSLF